MSEYKICWLSVDPVRRKVDFYPKSIATRIEKYYQERDIYTPSTCILGKDFFNATIHFHPSGSCYQTTPGISMGRTGFKQPGYRSVKRYIIDPNSDRVTVYSHQVYGEWRISRSVDESEITFNESVPVDVCLDIDNIDNIDDIVNKINTWRPDDLTSGSWDVDVIIWQWCRGTVEEQGNLLTLPDNWFIPYNSENTHDIEMAFQENRTVKIDLPVIGERNIVFIEGTCYAKQISLDGKSVRFMRRVIKNLQEVKVMLDRISNISLDINKVIENLPENYIPHHFNCPIMQDIMKDPVSTVDNHIYDRHAIERWFTYNNTSPLTGLPLTSKLLVPHIKLRNEINEFFENIINNKKDKTNLKIDDVNINYLSIDDLNMMNIKSWFV